MDNNERNRVLLKVLLEFNGYEVLMTVDGEEGVKMAKKEMPAKPEASGLPIESKTVMS